MRKALVGICLLVIGSGLFGPAAARTGPVAFQVGPTVSIGDVTLTEGDSGTVNAQFTITLSQVIDFPVTVSYATTDQTAVTGSDYTATTGSVPFGIELPTSRTINVPVVGDTTDEEDETFIVVLSSVSDVAIADGIGVCTILDDDDGVACTYSISPTSNAFPAAGGAASVTVTTPEGCPWTAASNAAFVTITSGGSGLGPGFVGYSVAANPDPVERTGTITVAGETFTVTQGAAEIEGPTLSISDDMVIETEGVVASIFTVRLSSPSAAEVRVDFQTSDGVPPNGATAPDDYLSRSDTVVFPPGTTLMTLFVFAVGDTTSEPDEQFFVDLANPVGAAILDGRGVSTIVDNDGDVACTYAIAPESVTVPPAGGPGTTSVTATAGCAWTAVSTSDFITITSGSTGTGTSTVTYTVAPNPSNGSRLGIVRIAGHRLRIEQTSSELPVAFVDDLAVVEGDSGTSTALVTVRLSEPSDTGARIDYRMRRGTASDSFERDYASSLGSVFFPPNDPGPQTIPVVIFGDEEAEIDEYFFVEIEAETNATIGDAVAVCTILNDDAPCEFVVAPTSLTFTPESGSQYVHVSTPETCIWSAASEVPWITVEPTPPRFSDGNGSANIRVGANLGPARSGEVTVAGQTITVNQTAATAASCSLLTPSGVEAFEVADVIVDVTDPRCGVGGDGCSHLAGVIAEFTVVNEVEGTFSRRLPLDEHGRATFTYSRSAPTTDEIAVTGVTREGLAFSCGGTIRWSMNTRCPLEDATKGTRDEAETLAASRKFRDGVLAKTERGRRYTALYYRFSGEALRIMMLNPMLMLRSHEIVARYRTVVAALAAGEEVTLTSGDLDEIEGFLDAFGKRGSAQLRDAIDGAIRDLRDPQVQTEFRLRVAGGPRREMPLGDSPIGILRLADTPAWPALFGLLVAGARRRKRGAVSIRTRAIALASLALVGLALSPRVAVAGSAGRFATYLGGTGDDEANAVAVDTAGNTYVVGFTDSRNFPTSSAAQTAYGGGQQDAFVTKLAPSGAVVYSTYLGGSGQDNAGAVAVDAAGSAYVTGFTSSSDFPVLAARQPALAGDFNAFVTKLDASGAVVFSTYLGGSAGDFASSIAVGPAGDVYLAGVVTSLDFPFTTALQPAPGGAADLFVARLDASASQLLFSARLGGSGNDGATSLAVDGSGKVHLTGVTSSPNFPTVRPSQSAYGGGLFDGFVAKLDVAGSHLVYSTFVGGSGDDRAYRVAVDAAGTAWVAGQTDSADLATKRAVQPELAGSVDAFVLGIDPSGSLSIATYLGGAGVDAATAIGVDGSGRVYVTGFTGSTDFPSSNAAQGVFGGGAFDAFATKLAPAGTSIAYSTYLGGSGTDAGFGVAVDAAGVARVMGQTDSIDLPTARAPQPAFGGGAADAFVSVLAATGPSISGASLRGAKLTVAGSGFDAGATILVDGRALRTRNDRRSPETSLVGRRPRIGRGDTVSLVVRNADGTTSPEFRFTR